MLKREVESNARIYEMLVSREKETGVLSGIRANNIRLVERAPVPDFPFSPNRPRALALGLLVGIVGGLGLVFFLEYLDDSVTDPDDLERHVRVPFLGPVPILEPNQSRGSARGTSSRCRSRSPSTPRRIAPCARACFSPRPTTRRACSPSPARGSRRARR